MAGQSLWTAGPAPRPLRAATGEARDLLFQSSSPRHRRPAQLPTGRSGNDPLRPSRHPRAIRPDAPLLPPGCATSHDRPEETMPHDTAVFRTRRVAEASLAKDNDRPVAPFPAAFAVGGGTYQRLVPSSFSWKAERRRSSCRTSTDCVLNPETPRPPGYRGTGLSQAASAPSSSTLAAPRAASVTVSPASIRAISSTRSCGPSGITREVVMPSATRFSTRQ